MTGIRRYWAKKETNVCTCVYHHREVRRERHDRDTQSPERETHVIVIESISEKGTQLDAPEPKVEEQRQ